MKPKVSGVVLGLPRRHSAVPINDALRKRTCSSFQPGHICLSVCLILSPLPSPPLSSSSSYLMLYSFAFIFHPSDGWTVRQGLPRLHEQQYQHQRSWPKVGNCFRQPFLPRGVRGGGLCHQGQPQKEQVGVCSHLVCALCLQRLGHTAVAPTWALSCRCGFATTY